MEIKGALGPVRTALSHMRPVEAHVAHLRHLGKLKTAEMILAVRHGFIKAKATTTGRMVASHVNQAIEFHTAAKNAQPQVRPVLQYYAYLNLAVATILVYRPDSTDYRRHGVSDVTHELKSLDLSSKVAEFRKGAVPALHQMLCGQELTGTIRLKDLAVAVPMLSVELEDAFHIKAHTIEVKGNLVSESDKTNEWVSEILFSSSPEPGESPTRVPVVAIETVVPMLREDYSRAGKRGSTARYRSHRSWPQSSRAATEQFHRARLLLATNLGSRVFTPGVRPSVAYFWRHVPRVPVYPTLSAGLIFSFVLASLCRYRPALVDQLGDSRINLLVDVFVNEADGFMIPTFRNLLYREELLVSPAEWA